MLLQKLKITATETELGECQAIFSAPLSGEELFVWPPQKTSKLFPNFQLVKDAAAKLCGGKPRKVRLTQRDGIGNGARVLQIQNQFEESEAGRQCKGRQPRIFSPSTRAPSGRTQPISLYCQHKAMWF